MRPPAPTPPSPAGQAPWRGRWQRWWLRRLPRQDQTRLTHRNLYILPTRAGLMLGVTLLLLLVGSINYQLNLGYLLTFLLAGCAVVALHQTHQNLRGLALQLRPPDPVFAGQAAPLQVLLHNPSRRHRHGVGLSWCADTEGASAAPSAPAEPVWADVPPQADTPVQLAHPTLRRGRQAVPPLRVETRFPLGTVRAWHWWRPAAEWLVYPAPETPEPPLPWAQRQGQADTLHTPPVRHGDETDGLRPYRRGDPLKWVLWKKAARQAEGPAPSWVSREFQGSPDARLWLDHAHCGLSDPEAQRSRLCAWVLRAEQLGLDYGLRLPGCELPPGQGPAHQRRCLEALACA